MISRRTILKGAVAASSLPIVAGLLGQSQMTVTPAAAGILQHPSLYKILYDRRFAAARAFGREAQLHGAPVHAFDGDVTDVWYHDLQPRWRQGRAPIAGLTAYGAFFCLDQLARDARMRVIQSTEHASPGQETLYSWVIA